MPLPANSTCSSGVWGGAGSCPCPCGWGGIWGRSQQYSVSMVYKISPQWSIFAIIPDVEPPWAGGFPGAVRWILGFWPVEEFLHLGRQYQKSCPVNLLWSPGWLPFRLLHPCLSHPTLAGGNSFSWALLPEEVSGQRTDRPWTERWPAVQNTASAMGNVLHLPVEENRGNLQSHWTKTRPERLLAEERTKPNVCIHWACWLSTTSAFTTQEMSSALWSLIWCNLHQETCGCPPPTWGYLSACAWNFCLLLVKQSSWLLISCSCIYWLVAFGVYFYP